LVKPVNSPLDDPIVATTVLLLLHIPAPDASPNVVETPEHMGLLPPVINAGAAVTVTVVVAIQPEVIL
jgi:hypothetical protein